MCFRGANALFITIVSKSLYRNVIKSAYGKGMGEVSKIKKWPFTHSLFSSKNWTKADLSDDSSRAAHVRAGLQ